MALAVSILAVGVAVWARAVVQGGHLQEAPAPALAVTCPTGTTGS